MCTITFRIKATGAHIESITGDLPAHLQGKTDTQVYHYLVEKNHVADHHGAKKTYRNVR